MKLQYALSPVALCALAFVARAQQPAASPQPAAPPPQPPPAACASAEFRAFDFWIGTWKVTDAKGNEIGASEITRVSNGCAVREQWSTPRGGNGTSLNFYEKQTGKWNQLWVGGGGQILRLAGGLEGKAMVLSGESAGASGALLNRITWTPLADGRVEQKWDTSADGGKTWQTSFVGYYARR
ncbi:MAG: hypothetical protein LC746_09835 [Acidobacteria bacterium]|nr:hypothetical protein [Acidobacteriota bacterium]